MYLLLLILGYLLGSIPTSLIIGKVFYNTDIRQSGSGNLGGTNALRVLGKVGFIVVLFDGLKCLLAVFIGSLYSSTCASYAGLLACIGHCYPIFAEFKGGKAVACAYGFYLGSAIFINNYYWIFVLAIIAFFIVFFKTEYVSLGSMLSSVIAWIVSLFQPYFTVCVSCLVIMVIIVYRHRENIKKLLNHEEGKFVIKEN